MYPKKIMLGLDSFLPAFQCCLGNFLAAFLLEKIIDEGQNIDFSWRFLLGKKIAPFFHDF